MAAMITLSGFKLPHYLNIIFPVTAVFTAAYLLEQWERRKTLKALLLAQIILCALCLLIAAAVNVWAFPVSNLIAIIGFVLLLAFTVFLLSRLLTNIQKVVGASVITSLLVFYLLNANFYPQLLKYQGGNELAFATKGKVDANGRRKNSNMSFGAET